MSRHERALQIGLCRRCFGMHPAPFASSYSVHLSDARDALFDVERGYVSFVPYASFSLDRCNLCGCALAHRGWIRMAGLLDSDSVSDFSNLSCHYTPLSSPQCICPM